MMEIVVRVAEAERANGERNCNGGNCERAKLGAEPCTDCRYCDKDGNL